MKNEFEILTKYISILNDNQYGEWVFDRQNNGSREHPIHMPYIKYSDIVYLLIADIYIVAQTYEKFNLTCYHEILEKHNIQWSEQSMTEADVSTLDKQCILALLVGTVQAERFCEGILMSFLENGCILHWLKRLQALDFET